MKTAEEMRQFRTRMLRAESRAKDIIRTIEERLEKDPSIGVTTIYSDLHETEYNKLRELGYLIHKDIDTEGNHYFNIAW